MPLTEQNRALWDQQLIRQGLDALALAEALGGADEGFRGSYTLQAALAACHARATPTGFASPRSTTGSAQ